MFRKNKSTWITLALSLLLTACISGSKVQKTYVLLSANAEYLADDVAATQSKKPLSVGLMPITLADHIDKESFVEYDKYQQIQYNNAMLWAEPIKSNTQNVLAQYLSLLLTSESSVGDQSTLQAGAMKPNEFKLFPWTVQNKPEVIISVEILRFGYDLSLNQLILEGSRSINAQTDSALQSDSKRFAYQIDIEDEANAQSINGNKKITLAYTQALAKLAEDLAIDIKADH